MKKFYTNPGYKGKFINYETFQSPYGGPRGKAIIALKQTDIDPISPISFFYHLQRNYRKHFNSIEWVRFHKFREGRYNYAVAIMNLKPSIEARKVLYELRERITKETGWYPLIMGSKARIHLPKIDRESNLSNRESIGSLDLNQLISVETMEDNGTCFKVHFDNGNILLDTGFHCSKAIDEQTKFIFISHFHQDHSGGLKNIISSDYSIPILLSLPTFNSLWYIMGVALGDSMSKRKDFLGKLKARALVVYPQDNLRIGEGAEFYIFESYHCPGSIGIRITDNSEKNLIYFGDVCLRNGFLDYTGFFKEQLSSDVMNASPTIFLLDSTFIKKRYANIPYTQTPQEVLDLIRPGREIPNVWFISKQVETLVYLFLYFFRETRKIYGYPKKLLLDNKLRILLQSLWTPYAQRAVSRMDPFLREEFLGERTNFIESHRIYPLHDNILKNLPDEENVIGFYSEGHFRKQYTRFSDKERARIYEDSRFYLIGEAASLNDLKKAVYELNPISFEKLSSADWLFHSNHDDLHEIICWSSRLRYTTAILFHNSPQNLKAFIEENRFDPGRVRCFENLMISL